MTTIRQASIQTVAKFYGVPESTAEELYADEIKAWQAMFDRPVNPPPTTCPDCAGSGANQNGSAWDCCDTCKGRKVI